MAERYDIVIVGGNMVGATLASAVADSGLRVAVLDSGPIDVVERAEYDVRVSAVTRASERVFRSLGAWEGMASRRISPFREMHVWDAGGRGSIHFDSADIGEETLGYIIENRVIQAALLERLGGFDNVDVINPSTLLTYEVRDDHVAIAQENGGTLEARLLVGADGRDSRVRALAGIAVQGWSYEQKAVVATVRPERHHRETAWQRFLPNGPLAFLPLTNGCCSIVWSTTPAEADELLMIDEAGFRARLQQAFDSTLGRILEVGPRAAFPLRLQHAQRYVQPRIALIGDAAHAIHPLAGQGANLGFLDAAALAEVILMACQEGKDIGGHALLRRYERWRKGDNLAMMFAMDAFKRMFGNSYAPVRLLRNFGLDLFNATGPVKNRIIRSAMGLSGDLPRLARV